MCWWVKSIKGNFWLLEGKANKLLTVIFGADTMHWVIIFDVGVATFWKVFQKFVYWVEIYLRNFGQNLWTQPKSYRTVKEVEDREKFVKDECLMRQAWRVNLAQRLFSLTAWLKIRLQIKFYWLALEAVCTTTKRTTILCRVTVAEAAVI